MPSRPLKPLDRARVEQVSSKVSGTGGGAEGLMSVSEMREARKVAQAATKQVGSHLRPPSPTFSHLLPPSLT